MVCPLPSTVWAAPASSGAIELDGDASDWDALGIEPVAVSNINNVSRWRVARGSDGTMYFCFEGLGWNDMPETALDWVAVKTQQKNGEWQETSLGTFLAEYGAQRVMTYQFTDWEHEIPVVMEVAIPASSGYFTDPDLKIYIAGSPASVISGAEIPQLGGDDQPETTLSPDPTNPPDPTTPPDPTEPQDPTAPPDPPAGHQGIVIDGQFDDWADIRKADVSDRYAPKLNETAMVWDGDKVYIYFMSTEGNYNAPAWSGPGSNGIFRITTDLGNVLSFQVTKDGTIAGVNGAQWAYDDTEWHPNGEPHMWELSIPTSELPPFLKTISLGFPDATMVEDVADLKGATGGPREEIVYDGLYGDWTYYPHTMVAYDGFKPGTKVGLYLKDTTLYGHVNTTLSDNLKKHGAEMSEFYIRINDDSSKEIPLKCVSVDKQGNIDWKPKMKQPDSTHEYLLVYRDGWQTASTLEELEASEHDHLFGRAYVTAGASQDDMEFKIDIEEMARYLKMSPEDISRITFRSTEFGDAEVPAVIGGISTGPWLGTLLCLGTVGAAGLHDRRKRRKEEEQ